METDTYERKYQENRMNISTFSDAELLAARTASKLTAPSKDTSDWPFWAWYDAVIDACWDRGFIGWHNGDGRVRS